MKYFEYTNIGPRSVNEDSYYISKLNNEIFACIADGVGGMKYGNVASEFVTRHFSKNLPDFKRNPISYATRINNELVEFAKREYGEQNVGTTFTAFHISSNFIKGVHIGDSRVCVLRGNGIKQLTVEHNEVGRLIREGKLKFSEKINYPRKNIIEHIMGSMDLFNCQGFEFELEHQDRILLSTDGFHETLSKKEIRDLSVKLKSFQEFNRRLIVELENRILRDNTTFITIEI